MYSVSVQNAFTAETSTVSKRCETCKLSTLRVCKRDARGSGSGTSDGVSVGHSSGCSVAITFSERPSPWRQTFPRSYKRLRSPYSSNAFKETPRSCLKIPSMAAQVAPGIFFTIRSSAFSSLAQPFRYSSSCRSKRACNDRQNPRNVSRKNSSAGPIPKTLAGSSGVSALISLVN